MKKTNRTNSVLTAFVCLLLLLASAQVNAQLTLSKAVSTNTPNVNVPFTYTLNYANPSITTSLANAVISDVIPSGINYVPGSIIGSNPAHIASTNYNSTTRVLTITLVNPLPAGSTGTLEFSAAFPSATYTNTAVTNTATSTSGSGPSTSNSVVVTAQNGLTPPVFTDDIQGAKNGSNTVAPGSGVNYGLVFGNLSTSPADNFEIIETIPAQLDLVQIGTGVFPGTSVPFTISYKTNLNSASWTPFTLSFNTSTLIYFNVADHLAAPLAPGEYITQVRWNYGTLPGNGLFYYEKPGATGPNLLFQVLTTDRNGVLVSTLPSFQNCITMSASINGVPKTHSYCATNPVSSTPILAALLDKVMTNPQAGYLKGDIINYRLSSGLAPQASTNWIHPVIIDLLPPELEYNGGLSYTYGGTQATNMGTPVFTQISNYNNTGQTLLKWEWPGYFQTNLFYQEIGILFNAKVRTSATVGQYVNTVIIGGNNSFSECNNYTYLDYVFSSVTDAADLDGDGNSTESLCKLTRAFNVVIPTAAGLESVKWVKGSLDGGYSKYPANGNTTPGGLADYQLIVKNPGTIPMNNIKIIDILPFVGDVGVIDPQTRLSQWRPFLVAPVTVPSGVTVYYSTQTNPCRDELAGVNPTPYPAGCQTAVWSTTPPTDITTVQALKFDFGSIVLAPNAQLQLDWPMRAPLNAPTSGEIAWNSFGYVGSRQDNGVALLPSEPIKVGIAITPPVPASIGNFVWNDTNANGLQDEPAANGINGVRVELWSDGGDNIPGNAGDNLLSFTLTSDLAPGQPGYYLFNDLPAGNYYIKFPTTTLIGASAAPLSVSNPSTTTNGNSDPSTSTGLSAVVHLDPLGSAIEQENLTIDAGYTSCTVPSSAIFTQVASTCTSGTSNNNGIIRLSSVTNGTHFGVSTLNAGSYDGVTSVGSATSISGFPTVITSTVPNTGGSYIVRIFNITSDCYVDVPVTIAAVTCICAAPPSVNITESNVSVCASGVATFNYTVANGPATITTSNGTIGNFSTTSLANGTGTFTYTPAVGEIGSVINFTATITDPDGIGTCAASSDNATVTSITLPTVNDPSDQPICAGSSTTAVTFSGTAGRYDWVNNTTSIGLAASGTGNIAAFTATNSTASPVVATITVTPRSAGPDAVLGNGDDCLGTTQTFTITVNPTPNLPAGPLSLTNGCPLATADLTSLSPADANGTTGTISYHSTLGGASNAANNTTNVVGTPTTVAAPRTYYIRKTTSNGCFDYVQVDVTSVSCACATPPSVVITESNVSVCATGLATFNYTVANGPATITTSNGTIGNFSTTSLANGTGTFTYTPTAGQVGSVINFTATIADPDGIGTCVASSDNATVTSIILPTVNDPSDQPVCAGGSTTAVTFSGTAGRYDWVNNTTSIGLAASGTGNIAAFMATNSTASPVTATITVTPRSAGPDAVLGNADDCLGTTQTFTITVNPTPNLPAGPLSLTNGCPLATADLTSLSPADANGTTGTISYHSTLGGASNAANNTTDVVGTPSTVAAPGTYYIRKTTANGCFDYVQVDVTSVSCACATPPSVVITESNVSVCATGIATFNYTVANGPATITTSNGTIGNFSTTSLANGTGTFTYTPAAGETGSVINFTATIADPDGVGTCMAASDNATVTSFTPVVLSASNGSVCSGGSIDLASLVTSSGGGTLSYYTSAIDANNAANNLSSSVVSPATATNYYIRSQGSGSCYDVKKVAVVIKPVVCGGISVTGPN